MLVQVKHKEIFSINFDRDTIKSEKINLTI